MIKHWDKNQVYGVTEKQMIIRGVKHCNENLQEGNTEELLTMPEIIKMFPAQIVGAVNIQYRTITTNDGIKIPVLDKAAIKYFQIPPGLNMEMQEDGRIEEWINTYNGMLDMYPPKCEYMLKDPIDRFNEDKCRWE